MDSSIVCSPSESASRRDLPRALSRKEVVEFVQTANKKSGVVVVTPKNFSGSGCSEPEFNRMFYAVPLLEKSWAFQVKWRAANPDKLYSYPGEFLLSKSEALALMKSARNVEMLGGHAKLLMLGTSLQLLNKWLEDFPDNIFKASFETKALYANIQKYIRTVWNVFDSSDAEGDIYIPQNLKGRCVQIRNGYGTAVNSFWGVASSIREIFYKEQDIFPTEEEMQQMVRTIPVLLSPLMKLHTSLFCKLRSTLVNSDSCNQFKHEFFRIGGSAESGWKICFSEKLLEHLPEKHLPEEKRFSCGCPALYARGVTGKNLLGEYYAWGCTLFRDYYLPALRQLESSGGNSVTERRS